MARIKQTARRTTSSPIKWVHHPYKDHAGQPATLLIYKETNPEDRDEDLIAQPEFAFQVYSTIPLDPDHEALCQYLAQEIDFRPGPAFEVYAPQPDAFACVEHQRREVAHRKRIRPGEDFFPGIAKVEPDEFDRLPQGFLLVIKSDVYRAGFQADDHYEKGTGPLLTFNRSFPEKTVVDVRSRCTTAPPYSKDVDHEPNTCPERNEITVQKCQDISNMKWDLK